LPTQQSSQQVLWQFLREQQLLPNTPFEGSERYATLFLGMNQTEDVNFDYFQPFVGVVVG
tara:strand:- start:342 stop:521 length:180 start_codon:yes stop_codon:yes gene_type:complete